MPVANLRGRRVRWMLIVLLATSVSVSLAVGIHHIVFGRGDRGSLQTSVTGKHAIVVHPLYTVFGEGQMTASFDLPVKNWWDTVLSVKGLSTSCGCGEATCSTQRISPGDVATVKLKVELPSSGQHRDVACVVHTDTGHYVVHQLRIVGYSAVSLLEPGQGAIDLGQTWPGGRLDVTRRLRFYAPECAAGFPVISSIECSRPELRVSVGAVTTPEPVPSGAGIFCSAPIRFALLADQPVGNYGAALNYEYRASKAL